MGSGGEMKVDLGIHVAEVGCLADAGNVAFVGLEESDDLGCINIPRTKLG